MNQRNVSATSREPQATGFVEGLEGLPTEIRSAVNSMFEALGVNTAIPGLRDTAKTLDRLLQDDVNLTPPVSSQWEHWNRLNQRVLQSNTPGTALQKASGFPVLDCLLADSSKLQIKRLMQLLVAGCMLYEARLLACHTNKKDLPKLDPTDLLRRITAAADQIRLACDRTGERFHIVDKFPSGIFSLKYLIDLESAIQALKPLYGDDRTTQHFLRTLQALINIVLELGDVPNNTPAAGHPVDNVRTDLGSIRSQITPSDDGIAEEFEQSLTLREPKLEAGESVSPLAFEASGLQTVHFLAQVESGIPWQRTRISPIERPALITLLRQLPVLIDGHELSVADALVTALVAATGLTPEDLVAFKVGSKSDLSWNGNYRKRIRRPQNAFKPGQSKGTTPLYDVNAVTQVTLSLPRGIKVLLARAGESLTGRTLNLGSLLGINPADPEKHKIIVRFHEAIGRLLRKHVSRRLTYRHLSTALRYAVYDVTRDPLYVYLLAGRPNLAPPVQMYYTNVTVEKLMQVHHAVMERLFGPG